MTDTYRSLAPLDALVVAERFRLSHRNEKGGISVAIARRSVASALASGRLPEDALALRAEVLAAVREFERAVLSGGPPPPSQRLLVRGQALCDWLDLGELARLLRLSSAGQL
jgi:hypothetical protein